MGGSIGEIVSEDKRWMRHYQECLMRNVRSISGINQSTAEQDMTEGFDYVFDWASKKIAVRRRAYSYYKRFGDFTIRSSSYYGGTTEIHKIRDGFGDVYLYVWEDKICEKPDKNGKKRIKIYYFLIVDLHQFRESGLAFQERKMTNNGDGTGFVSYSVEELFKADCLLACEKF